MFAIDHKGANSYCEGVGAGQQKFVVFSITVSLKRIEVTSPCHFDNGILDQVSIWVHNYTFHPCI